MEEAGDLGPGVTHRLVCWYKREAIAAQHKGASIRVSLFHPYLLKAVVLLGVLGSLSAVPARAAHRDLIHPYAPAHTWAVFGEYSPSSSHIILGAAREREFAALGLAYTHNMYRGQHWDLSYLFEVRPFMAESDPVMTGFAYNIDLPGANGSPAVRASGVIHFSHELPVLEIGPRVSDITFTYKGKKYYADYTQYYGRRWTYVGGMSPLGLKINFFPHSRLQPMLTANGGFAASLRDVPMFDTSAGNFTFSFGAGFDVFRRFGYPLRLEYRIQHFSNAYVGNDPGIDSQMIYVGYVWGQ